MGQAVYSLEEALTDTLPRVTREAGTVVALESSLAVTGKHLSAGLASLPGAHLTTPAAIQQQRDSLETLRGRTRTNAGSVTQLTQHLKGNTHRNKLEDNNQHACYYHILTLKTG